MRDVHEFSVSIKAEIITYVGDGVYAMWDGYQMWVATQREDGQLHYIALEPGVMNELNIFYKNCAAGVHRDRSSNS
jgi:hypothetical protein